MRNKPLIHVLNKVDLLADSLVPSWPRRLRDAVAIAARILQDQLAVFINFEEEVEEHELVEEEPKPNENLFRTIGELELSVRAANCLKNANILYIGELVQRSEAEMLKTKNFGRKSLNEIKQILGDMSLSLGMKVEHWAPPETQPEQAAEKETKE